MQPVAQPNIPINVNAALLGKPLAQVDAVVNLGLKNLGLGLKKKDILPVIANVDLLGKPLVVVDGLVEVLEKPHELLAVDVSSLGGLPSRYRLESSLTEHLR